MTSLPAARVIVVAWHSEGYLPACLDSLLAQKYPGRVVIHVIDNGSTDDTAKVLAGYGERIVAEYAGRNLGFPRAVNRALRACREEIVVLLNPDTVMDPDWLSELVQGLLLSDEIGAAGSLLLYPDGTIQHAGGRVYANGITGHYGAGQRPRPAPERYWEAEYATGAALAIRATDLREIGGLDEGYPMYGEDVQLAALLARRGRKTIVVAAARGVHFESVGSRREGMRYLYRLHRARLRVAFLNFPVAHLLRRWPREEIYYLWIAGMLTTYRFFPVMAAHLTTLARVPWLLTLRKRPRYRVHDRAAYARWYGPITAASIRGLVGQLREGRASEPRRA